ncbi:thymidylate synthase [uncultured Tateyamaria sp.]|uniref:thymidylate synthase n=1 Tax=Tateyamaria sp. TaxID=1929288 RepID=UPI002606513D|nr:thymidylate synthase [uncultured Tateyamaria sp.]
MKRTAAVCALALGVAACGDGNPFTDGGDTTTGGGTATSDVPANILGDLERISFNASDNTLTVTGLTQDGVPLVNSYTAVSNTFAPGYTTFTGQNDPLGRHATAFVASRDGVQAGVVMTGGQFNKFFGGTFFERTGTYTAPTAPEGRFDVTYYGNYAAGLNGVGPVTDLLPITQPIDPDVNTPTQTAYITGLMFVNVDLNDMSVEGEIYDRTAVFGAGFGDLADLVLVDGTLTGDGTFTGNIEVDATDPNPDAPDDPVGVDIGDFAGVIGGTDGSAMAGGTFIEDFSDALGDEIEYGVFVLDLCVAGNTDPICVNAVQP